MLQVDSAVRSFFRSNIQVVLSEWTILVSRFAWLVILTSIILAAAAFVFIQHNFQINTSTQNMLSSELSYRKSILEMDTAFPQSKNNILVVIESEIPGLADESADRLVEAIRNNQKRYGKLFDLESEKFFKANGLLYLDSEKLYRLSDELAMAQPFIAFLLQDPNLRGLFDFLSKVIGSLDPQKSDNLEIVNRLILKFTKIGEEQLNGKISKFSLWDLMGAGQITNKKTRRLFVIKPQLDYETLNPASATIESLRNLSKSLSLTPDNGVKVRLTGSPAIEKEELDSVERGMGGAILISLISVVLLLFFGLKRYQLILSTVLVLLVGLALTTALGLLIFEKFNLISVAFAVLFIGLSVDFSIHYGLRYLEIVTNEFDHNRAINITATNVGTSLLLAAMCAAIAFFSFLPTDYKGLAELGVIAGVGMIIAVFLTLSLLPALLSVFPKICSPDLQQSRVDQSFLAFLDSNPKLICVTFLVIGCISLALSPRVKFDFDPLSLKDQSGEAMVTLNELAKSGEINPYSIKVLVRNLKDADRLATLLNNIPEVQKTKTLSSYLPLNQQEKLEIIDSMGLFLSPALSNLTEARQINYSQLIKAYETFDHVLGALISKNLSFAEKIGVLKFRRVLSGLVKAGKSSIESYQERIFGNLPDQVEDLRQSLSASRVDIDHLPKQLRENNLARDGRAKIEIIPYNDIHERERLASFVKNVREIAPLATGAPVVILEAGKAVLSSFYQAGLIASLLIFFLLLVVVKNLGQTLIIFSPLFLAGLFSLSIMVLFGLSFNFANVIVLPLLFGLGVAGSLHLVIRNNQKSPEKSIFLTSTPRAVLFSALTTVFSFGSISLSEHPGTSSMGILLTITVVTTLSCTLVFLPAALKLIKKT